MYWSLLSLVARARHWIEPPLPGEPPPISSGDPLIDTLLRARGVLTEAAIVDWLDDSPRPAPDPSSFPNMEAALLRTAQAVERGERIAIFGDYDADGVTSTAILALALAAATGADDRVATRLPTRAEGYGLTFEAIDRFAGQGTDLLIAVDCGSNDVEALTHARQLGLDTIVLDHHRLTRAVDAGELIVNPRLAPEGPGHELTAAGLAYCFVTGLPWAGVVFDTEPGASEPDLGAFLDLAAIGTIVDVGSLTGLNRGIVRDGIIRLRRTGRPGLRALLDIAGCAPANIDVEVVSFKLGPRLNAPGRVDSPRVALDLLMTGDPTDARRLATTVETLNQTRQATSATILREATAQVEPTLRDGGLIAFAHSERWPAGMAGAVAGKLAETYGVPAIVFEDRPDMTSVGSARSVDGLDLFAALSAQRHPLDRFGGHSQAAGLTIKTADLDAFRDAMEDAIRRTGMALPSPIVHRIDADLRTADLTLATIRSTQHLAPFGTGNPEPLFRLRRARVLQSSRMGADRSHLRLVVQGPSSGIKAVMFRAGERATELAGRTEVDLLATLEADIWGGDERFALKIVDFRPVAG
jgi:single-stranded-DNA-specific exonuclease